MLVLLHKVSTNHVLSLIQSFSVNKSLIHRALERPSNFVLRINCKKKDMILKNYTEKTNSRNVLNIQS